MTKYFALIILTVFALLSAVFYSMITFAPAYSFPAMMTANALMASLSLLSYFIVQKQIKSRPEAFVRGVYSATFLKLMICMVAILIYIMLFRKTLHKPSIFVLFGIYAVYTAIETIMLQKLAKKTN